MKSPVYLNALRAFEPSARDQSFSAVDPSSRAEPGPEEESPLVAATVEEPQKERTPCLDWAGLLRGAFALDVFTCVRCGGRRRVLAPLTAPGAISAIVEHLGLPARLPNGRMRRACRVQEENDEPGQAQLELDTDRAIAVLQAVTADLCE